MDLKKLAKDIGTELAKKNARLPHTTLLEIVAKAAGHASWNHAAAGNQAVPVENAAALPSGFSTHDDAKQLGVRFMAVLSADMNIIPASDRDRALGPLKVVCSPVHNLSITPYQDVHRIARSLLDNLITLYSSNSFVASKREIRHLLRMTNLEKSHAVKAFLKDESNDVAAIIDAVPWLSAASKDEVIRFVKAGWDSFDFPEIAETYAAAATSAALIEMISRPNAKIRTVIDEKKAKAWLDVWRPDLRAVIYNLELERAPAMQSGM